ncbi:MAG: bifunctional metallophosphatase/5'-nucleotidase [Blastocatellia bacterium]|nr:MAG: bifunctional metallophosphatase/5'-nucleotidase [Blastocatellia bacterium]
MSRMPLGLWVASGLLCPIVLFGQSARGAVVVQLLAINDFHGALEPPEGATGRINMVPAGGAEYLSTHLKNALRENPNSVIVAAGDLIGATPLTSALFHDEPAIETMNAIGLSVSAVGNHEFDHGWRALMRLQRGGCDPTDGCRDGDGFSGAKFQYLSANVVRKTNRALQPLFPATAIRSVGGVKIGFIGETLRRTRQLVTPTGVRGLSFLDEWSVANRHAARLKLQGINAIVLLIHEGGQQNPGEPAPEPNGCANLTGAIVPIVQKLSPAIGVIVSAHTHQFYNCTIDGHTVTSAGSNGRMFTRVNLTIDSSTDTITNVAASNEVVTRDVEKDPAITRLLTKYSALSRSTANRVVGTASAEITARRNHAGESALGDVIADAQLAATSPAAKGGARVAFMNPGGIRADIVGNVRPDGSQVRDVTYAHLFTVQPFGNTLTVLTMTGEQIRQLLEQQFDSPNPGESRILQVSAGFSYRYALGAPAGQHVDPASIQIAGRIVRPTDRVRVAANSFLVAGGDNFTIFEDIGNFNGGDIDVDALMEYFRTHSPAAPGPQNRIVRTD